MSSAEPNAGPAAVSWSQRGAPAATAETVVQVVASPTSSVPLEA
jgi:hypothetical protein